MDEPKAADLPAAVENLESENQLLQIKNAVSCVRMCLLVERGTRLVADACTMRHSSIF